ncbi:MAG TPA: hypothetical protein DDX19_07100 [Rhodopirellula baltica]|uniref:Uncharacterized protein n=2 Tax=Rhodopirellula baltica TaxID=265606 RepID=K5E5E3_RHOBT|nr:hypothetical protein RBSH_03675 [Rhodopirellula baltica SH28]ELP31859.1 hypothetical protein RBSWK_04365 [Rhodopirellula baltica SWK14]HBE62500.1 hypothetical protein [Rhodopirellula baltica]
MSFAALAIDDRLMESTATIVRRGRVRPVTHVKAAIPCASGNRQFFGFASSMVDKSFMAPMKSVSRR